MRTNPTTAAFRSHEGCAHPFAHVTAEQAANPTRPMPPAMQSVP